MSTYAKPSLRKSADAYGEAEAHTGPQIGSVEVAYIARESRPIYGGEGTPGQLVDAMIGNPERPPGDLWSVTVRFNPEDGQ